MFSDVSGPPRIPWAHNSQDYPPHSDRGAQSHHISGLEFFNTRVKTHHPGPAGCFGTELGLSLFGKYGSVCDTSVRRWDKNKLDLSSPYLHLVHFLAPWSQNDKP